MLHIDYTLIVKNTTFKIILKSKMCCFEVPDMFSENKHYCGDYKYCCFEQN